MPPIITGRPHVPQMAGPVWALAETSDQSGGVRGLLRVGFVRTTEGPPLSRLVAAFHACYPEARSVRFS